MNSNANIQMEENNMNQLTVCDLHAAPSHTGSQDFMFGKDAVQLSFI